MRISLGHALPGNGDLMSDAPSPVATYRRLHVIAHYGRVAGVRIVAAILP